MGIRDGGWGRGWGLRVEVVWGRREYWGLYWDGGSVGVVGRWVDSSGNRTSDEREGKWICR